ncbi:MAG TPA: tetratricopeptide repeat protein [Candidatus Limnocylindrales bacterium]
MTGQAVGQARALAVQLDRLRRHAGLSFRDLSRLTGHPVSTLHNALTGRVVPRLDTVLSIVRACGEDEASWRSRWADVTGRPGPAGVPRELPRAARGFAGRKAEMSRLAELIEREHDQGVGIVAVHGMPGVGKTAFAVRAAHEFSRRFPDGQIFADLRAHGPGTVPMTPAEALPALLRSLGVTGQRLPSTLDGQVRLYRTVLCDRRVLVLLDDALDAEQVRALIPSGKGCMLIVTSRNRLDGILALDGAHAFHLGVLSAAESLEMLTHLLGPGDAERREAYRRLAELCGGLPLALRVAAATMAIEPRVPIAEALAELAVDPMTGLQMPAGQVAVRATFAQSYQRLSGDASALLRRLGDAPCGWFTVDSAAALLDAPEDATRRALEELTARCLVDKQAGRRYAMHALVRLFAADRAREEDPAVVRQAALDRLLIGYQRKVEAAAQLLYPERLRLPVSGLDTPDPPVCFEDKREALDMLDTELENVAALTAGAATQRPQSAVWCLADALRGYFVLRLRLQEWIAVADAGLRAAEALGDRQAQGAMRHSLGVAYSHRGDQCAAEHHLAQALALYRSVEWVAGRAAVLICLGDIYFERGRLDEASAVLEEALDLAARHDMPALEAAALGDLGEVYRDRGLLHKAREHQLHTARRCLELGMSRGHAIALVCLGLVCLDLGEPESARKHLTDARKRLAALGSRDGESYAAIGLAAVGVAVAGPAAVGVAAVGTAPNRPAPPSQTGFLAEAARALAMAESIADSSLIVEASLVRAEALRVLGRPAEAAGDARRACEVASEKDYQRGLARALVALAGAHLDLGDLAEARACCLRGLELSTSRGYRVTAANALTMLAALDHRAGDNAAAAGHAHRALDSHRETGHRTGETKTLILLDQLESPEDSR